MTQGRLYARIGGSEKGPYEPGEIKELVREGILKPDDYLRRGDDARWVRAGEIKGLAGLFEEAKFKPHSLEALFEGLGGEAAAIACPGCGASAEADAVFCTECGAPLKPGAPPAARGACPDCGALLEPDASFCTACGGRLPFAETPVPQDLAAPVEAPPARGEEVFYYKPTFFKKLKGFARRHKFLTIAGAFVFILAVVLAAAAGVDYADNGLVDGSVLGYAGRAGPEELPAAERPGAAEEAGTQPTVELAAISAAGGGRTVRSVTAGLKADSGRLAKAFAGAADGNVELEITVARNGAVVKTRVRASSYADAAWERKVEKAVRACRLEPADGVTVAVVRLRYREGTPGTGSGGPADRAPPGRNTTAPGDAGRGTSYARVEVVDDEVDYENCETMGDRVHRYFEKRPPKPYLSDKRRYEMGNIYDAGDNRTFRVDNPHEELVLYFSWAPISGPMGLRVADEAGRVIFDRKLSKGPTLKVVGKGRYVVTVYYAGAKYGGTWHCEYYV
jgi:hypothetical protein